ncbi:MAG TPA: hypothetical protein VHR66_32920 [Gemmataceae bacterium]|nr:hypothetical protein [Gemmataceae bacterium]
MICLAVVGSSLALLVAWGTLIPLKLSGPMPAHYSWPVVIVAPLTVYGWLTGTLVLMLRYPQRQLTVVYCMAALVVTILVVLFACFIPGGLHGSKDLPRQ